MRERADALARKIAKNPDDPFDVALLTETDLDRDGARLEEELSAISMMGGRRLVRLKLTGDKIGPEKTASEALVRHAEGELNPDAFFLIEAGALERTSPLRKAAEKADGAASIPVYEDETGDVSRMVREALSKDGVGLTSDALELFVARLPRERGVARQEIERLILYLGPNSGAQASIADLTDHLGVEPEASLADAAQDAFGARAGPAQAALRRARAEGGGGDRRRSAPSASTSPSSARPPSCRAAAQARRRRPRRAASSGRTNGSSCASFGPGNSRNWKRSTPTCWRRITPASRPARRIT